MAFDFVSINSKSAYDVINLKLETESYEAIRVQLQKRMSKSHPAGTIFCLHQNKKNTVIPKCLRPISKIHFHSFIIYICMCPQITEATVRGQPVRINPLTILCAMGIKLRPLGLEASTFTCWAILVAQGLISKERNEPMSVDLYIRHLSLSPSSPT